jgi:hypothetical protein
VMNEPQAWQPPSHARKIPMTTLDGKTEFNVNTDHFDLGRRKGSLVVLVRQHVEGRQTC